MFDSATLITYVIIVIGLFLVPGPAVLLVITRTIQCGRIIGIMTGLGVATGDLIHTLCADLGLSALLMTSAVAFSVIKTLGAYYLIYIGLRAFFSKYGNAKKALAPAVKPTTAYVQAVGAEVMNPKTAIFFLSFLPQFVHTQASSAFTQFMCTRRDTGVHEHRLHQYDRHDHSAAKQCIHEAVHPQEMGRENYWHYLLLVGNKGCVATTVT